jgi:2-polyprenyl-6-methoxyphenol hydroxylase-like FAD-dependent oxidoreductase
MNPPLVKVLIVGAGPVGLAMGCELLQQGIPCRIIEQTRPAKAPPAASGVVLLHSRTLEVLSTLQVLDEALALGLKIHSFTLHDGKSHIASISTEDADTPYPYNLVLPQAELSRILETRLVRLGGAVERGLQCKSLTQDQDGVTAAVVRQGGQVDKVRASWLIGCDGDKSAVRQAVGLKWEGGAEDEACAVADVVMDPSLARDEVNIALSASGVLSIIPLPGAGRARLIQEGARLPESLTLEHF